MSRWIFPPIQAVHPRGIADDLKRIARGASEETRWQPLIDRTKLAQRGKILRIDRVGPEAHAGAHVMNLFSEARGELESAANMLPRISAIFTPMNTYSFRGTDHYSKAGTYQQRPEPLEIHVRTLSGVTLPVAALASGVIALHESAVVKWSQLGIAPGGVLCVHTYLQPGTAGERMPNGGEGYRDDELVVIDLFDRRTRHDLTADVGVEIAVPRPSYAKRPCDLAVSVHHVDDKNEVDSGEWSVCLEPDHQAAVAGCAMRAENFGVSDHARTLSAVHARYPRRSGGYASRSVRIASFEVRPCCQSSSNTIARAAARPSRRRPDRSSLRTIVSTNSKTSSARSKCAAATFTEATKAVSLRPTSARRNRSVATAFTPVRVTKTSTTAASRRSRFDASRSDLARNIAIPELTRIAAIGTMTEPIQSTPTTAVGVMLGTLSGVTR